tara:strand:- start:699 stop:986 length:288 start_codon:yes stop_codon:yes gene_type:complete
MNNQTILHEDLKPGMLIMYKNGISWLITNMVKSSSAGETMFTLKLMKDPNNTFMQWNVGKNYDFYGCNISLDESDLLKQIRQIKPVIILYGQNNE